MSSLPETTDLLGGSTGYLLAMIGAESRRHFTHALNTLELRPAHYGALMTLAASGPASQQTLARSVGIDPRNFVQTLDQLQARQLIQRHPHPSDRRRHQVQLTEAGQQLLTQLRTLGERTEQDFLAPLTPHEQQQLHDLLSKLHRTITED